MAKVEVQNLTTGTPLNSYCPGFQGDLGYFEPPIIKFHNRT